MTTEQDQTPDDATALQQAEQRLLDPAPFAPGEMKAIADAIIAEMKAEIADLREKLAKPVVPTTDTKPAPVTTPEPDFSTLSPVAKIASGYKK
jgi:hypothetical protein